MRGLSTLVVATIAFAGRCYGVDEPRRIQFTYSCEIRDVMTDAASVELWMPVPSDCDGQTIDRVEVVRPEDGRITTENRYGNRMLYCQFRAPFEKSEALGAELVFEFSRREVTVTAAPRELDESAGTEPGRAMEAYLAPNTLIPIDGRVAEIAADLDLPTNQPLRAARRVYDYLIESMDYNWQAKGAGRGDVLWACDSRTGDCTDYHSTFIALCRSQGIPADHQFGFPVPDKKREGAILHYHCWAQFWVGGFGWIPVDISEADKHPALREYNFGSFSANYLRLSHGRDVTLEPPQAGKPLNIFVFPYVEVDGQPHEGVRWRASFKELDKS